jgi:hypothetical protein
MLMKMQVGKAASTHSSSSLDDFIMLEDAIPAKPMKSVNAASRAKTRTSGASGSSGRGRSVSGFYDAVHV